MSDRVFTTATVAGSPAAAAETIVATVTVGSIPRSEMGVLLCTTVAFTVGTSGTAFNLRLRRTGLAGTVVFNTGALTAVAGNLLAPAAIAFDAIGTAQNQVYVATLQVTGGAAASTVSAVNLTAVVL
jgi:hypothetical protein